MFRPDAEPLLPNWRHLPVGYHGRAGTVVVSGTPVGRPHGQRKPPDADAPRFGPSRRLDIELELGFVIGAGAALGEPDPGRARRRPRLRLVLVNDWSARDIQAWEYVPLGPFLGKSFATSIRRWVVPLAALEARRVPAAAAGARRRCRYLREAAALGARHRRSRSCSTARSSRAAERARPVLDVAAAARPPDRQRRAHPHRRPVRLRHDLRAGARHARLVPRADAGTARSRSARRRLERTFLEDGDEVVLRGADLGEVRGRVLSSGR